MLHELGGGFEFTWACGPPVDSKRLITTVADRKGDTQKAYGGSPESIGGELRELLRVRIVHSPEVPPFGLAADLANLQRWKNCPMQETVGVDRVTGSIGTPTSENVC